MTAPQTLTANGVTTAYPGQTLYVPAGSRCTLAVTGGTTQGPLSVASSYLPFDKTTLEPAYSATGFTVSFTVPSVACTVSVPLPNTSPPSALQLVVVADGSVQVQTFGAAGDGTTDDSGAIQAGINALAGTGLSLYLPAGTYYVNAAAIANTTGVPIVFGPGAAVTGANASSLTSQAISTPNGSSVTVPVTTGTVTLTATQAQSKTIVLTGSLTGNVALVLPPNPGQTWIIDATGCTLNAHTITAQANSNSWGTTIGVSSLYQVTYYGPLGKLVGGTLTT
jgi:hypothetical protein